MWAYIVAGLCFAYFLGVLLFGAVGTNFYVVWAVLGTGFLSYAVLSTTGVIERYMPIWIRRSVFLCFLLGVALFLVVEGMIISGYVSQKKDNLDCIIVLGAQVKPGGPSKVLAYRLDEAYEYWMENPDTVVIVSGGKGHDEPETEAACMSRYLRERGVEESCILEEDRSTNTVENLQFSKKLLESLFAGQEKNEEQFEIGIVSNNFHMFRAMHIAKKQGYQKVVAIPAPSYVPMQMNNMLREFLGVMKDYLYGNL